MVPPLSERPVTEEDEEQFRRESAPRKYTLWERWSDYRADVKRNRPKGAKARFRGVDGRRRRGLGDPRGDRVLVHWRILLPVHQRCCLRLVACLG